MQLVSISTAAFNCGYSETYVYRLIQIGFIDRIKIDNKSYLDETNINLLKMRRNQLHPEGLQKEARKQALKKRSQTKSRKQWAGLPDDVCPAYIVNRRKKQREKNSTPEKKAILKARAKSYYDRNKAKVQCRNLAYYHKKMERE